MKKSGKANGSVIAAVFFLWLLIANVEPILKFFRELFRVFFSIAIPLLIVYISVLMLFMFFICQSSTPVIDHNKIKNEKKNFQLIRKQEIILADRFSIRVSALI